VLTTAEVHLRQLTFVTTLECRSMQGDPRGLALRLDTAEGDDVHLEAANVLQQREERRGPSTREWVLDLQPGLPDPYRLTLTVTRSLQEGFAVPIPIPRVSVAGATHTDQWLALHGPDLAPETASRLSPVTGAAAVAWQKAWPLEAERLRRLGGAVWQILDQSSLRLTSRSGLAGPAPLRVFLVDQTAAVADGRTWLHQATGWLYHYGNTDLEVVLPDGATFVRATIDGVTVVPMQGDGQHIWLRLPVEAGARRVTIRWKFDPASEPLDKPNLAQPRFDGVTEEEQTWCLHVPRGYRAESSTITSPTQRDLRRAEAQMRLSGALAEQARGGGSNTGQLLAAQQRFYLACRFAEQDLATAPADAADAGWLQNLREQNLELARSLGFERTRADAERQVRVGLASADVDNGGGPPDDPLPDQGTPLYGQGNVDMSPPQLHLQTAGVIQTRRDLATLLVLLCALTIVGILSYFPRVLAWVRRFWPEQMALLAALLWLMAGPPLVVDVLICLAIVGRLLELVVLAYRSWRRPVEKTAVAVGTSAS
jgi:hypothetical protein